MSDHLDYCHIIKFDYHNHRFLKNFKGGNQNLMIKNGGTIITILPKHREQH